MDLPGLGMSSGSRRDWATWLTAVVETSSGVHLIGHSIGAAAAIEVAAAEPDRVGLITLVAPFFLQPAAGFSARLPRLSHWYLRRDRPDVLSRSITGIADHGEALESSVLDLRRGRAAANVAELLAASAGEEWRSKLRATLASYPGPVHVIVGSEDPLTDQAHALLDSLGPRVTLTTIAGAGHHPQVTHAGALARAIGQHPLATPALARRGTVDTGFGVS